MAPAARWVVPVTFCKVQVTLKWAGGREKKKRYVLTMAQYVDGPKAEGEREMQAFRWLHLDHTQWPTLLNPMLRKLSSEVLQGDSWKTQSPLQAN